MPPASAASRPARKQRGLAAARRADEAQQRRADEARDELRDEPFAPAVVLAVGGVEGRQALERAHERQRPSRAAGGAARSRVACSSATPPVSSRSIERSCARPGQRCGRRPHRRGGRPRGAPTGARTRAPAPGRPPLIASSVVRGDLAHVRRRIAGSDRAARRRASSAPSRIAASAWCVSCAPVPQTSVSRPRFAGHRRQREVVEDEQRRPRVRRRAIRSHRARGSRPAPAGVDLRGQLGGQPRHPASREARSPSRPVAAPRRARAQAERSSASSRSRPCSGVASAASSSSGSGARSTRHERGVLAQDLVLEAPQRCARLEPELVAHARAEALERFERLGLAPGAIERRA